MVSCNGSLKQSGYIYNPNAGCRNTEERLAVATPPKKTALATKRERAAALSAKAAAAAAKAGINIHLKPAPGSAAFNGQQFGAGAQAPAAATPAQILQLPDLDLENIITLPPPNAATATATKKLPPAPVQGQSLFFTSQPLTPPKEVNVCKQPVNVALLECILVQAAEAEELGLNEVQVGKLILHEFARGLQAIIKVYDVWKIDSIVFFYLQHFYKNYFIKKIICLMSYRSTYVYNM